MARAKLVHDRHYDFEPDEAGDFVVQTSAGPARRRRISVNKPGNFTLLEFPDDYTATPLELSHLADMINANHANTNDIHSVWSGNPRLALKLAAAFDAEILDEEPQE